MTLFFKISVCVCVVCNLFVIEDRNKIMSETKSD